jgi:hypothetical protein
VRENAISNPAPTAGAKIKKLPLVEPSIFLLCWAALFLRLAGPKDETVADSSPTTRVSIAQASAAKSADEKLIRIATFPNGTSEAR